MKFSFFHLMPWTDLEEAPAQWPASNAAFGPPLAAIAQEFNAPENFSLMLLGLVTAVVLAHGSVIKAIGMVLVLSLIHI